MKMMRMMCVAALLAASTTGAWAQAPAADATPKGAVVSPAATFDPAWSTIEKNFLGVANAMPGDKYIFAPSQAIFVASQKTDYKGVNTFGGMVAHVTQANYYYFSTASGLKPDIDLKSLGPATPKDDLVKALAASFAFGHKAIAAMTADSAFKSVRGVQTPASLVAGVMAHANDHYGQLVEYLRMNGIIPPASAK